MTVARSSSRQRVKLIYSGLESGNQELSPNSFEGVGAIGLPWMKRVKEETGLENDYRSR